MTRDELKLLLKIVLAAAILLVVVGGIVYFTSACAPFFTRPAIEMPGICPMFGR